MTSSTLARLSAVAVLYFSFSPFGFAQGDLNPPAGTPAPTMKTLDQIDAKLEKRVDVRTLPGDANAQHIISQPGSYYLGANITGGGKTAISIRAANVTLDLNGFALDGNGGAGGGINSTGTVDNVVVRNGIIRGWAGSGVFFASAPESRCENLQVRSNGGVGIQVGDHSKVLNCVASGNSASGIRTLSNSSVIECVARGNGDEGIFVGVGSTVQNCTASANIDAGILTTTGCTVVNCTASANTGPGTVYGISTGAGSTIVGCTSFANTSTNPSTTTGGGIFATQGAVVRNCTTRENRGDGINVGSDCLVTGNSSVGNGKDTGTGAGIEATGEDNRIDGNNVADNDIGIAVTGAGNLIIKNSASGNGPTNNLNYSIAANNRYGAIIDITATGTAAVNGNAGTDTSDTAHPWANFSY